MGAFSGNCPDLVVFREDTKIIFDQEFILFEWFRDFYDNGFSGNSMANEPHQWVNQKSAAEKKNQATAEQGFGIFFSRHRQRGDRKRITCDDIFQSSFGEQVEEPCPQRCRHDGQHP